MLETEPRLYIFRDGKTVEGSFDANDVRYMVRRGEISSATLVCQKGTENWMPFHELPPRPWTPPPEPTAQSAPTAVGVFSGSFKVAMLIAAVVIFILWIAWLNIESEKAAAENALRMSNESAKNIERLSEQIRNTGTPYRRGK